MGSVISSIFGGGSKTPEIEVSEPVSAPLPSVAADPVSSAVRDMEQKRLRAKRAFYGTLLTGKSDSGKKSDSLL